ncbi:CLC2D protein, partial [Nothocercus julius]|nr:CLC2D protein [Nothocercus julius]
ALPIAVQAFQPPVPPCARCPFTWIGYRGKCYHFSGAEGNWTAGRDNCSALGASLAAFDGVEELSFLLRHQGSSEHWVGLWRPDEQQPWQWVNGSRWPAPFGVGGGGPCAYVTASGLGSSRCSAERSWVCTKAEGP